MNPINLDAFHRLIPVVEVKGEIHDSQDPFFLSEDLVEIVLSNGDFVDIGWYPEHETDGEYIVRLWPPDVPDEIKRATTRSAYEAVGIAYNWCLERTLSELQDPQGEWKTIWESLTKRANVPVS